MTSSERTLLAQELHDGIAQDLVAIGYALDLIIGDANTSSDTKISVRQVRFNVTELTERVRTEIHDLYRQDSDDFLEHVESLIKRVSLDIKIQLASNKDSITLNPDLAYQVLKILGELLRNIVAHSGAQSAFIDISDIDGRYTISISDDGTSDISPTGVRYGLKGALGRTELIGGTLNWTRNDRFNISTLVFPTE